MPCVSSCRLSQCHQVAVKHGPRTCARMHVCTRRHTCMHLHFAMHPCLATLLGLHLRALASQNPSASVHIACPQQAALHYF